MKNTGALLKAKRESSNLSLSEVALATKINPKVLAAIENGDEKSLPAKTILKGFVRSYALFLKMDVDSVLRTFQEEMSPPPAAEASPASTRAEASAAPARRRVTDESSSGLRTAAVVVIVLLIGLIIGVRELIEKYQREKVVEQPVALTASPIATPEPPKTEVLKTEEAAKAEGETAKTEEAAPAPQSAPEPAEEEPAKAEPAKTETAAAAKPEAPKAEEKPAAAPEHEKEKTEPPRPVAAASRPMGNLVELHPTSMLMMRPDSVSLHSSSAPPPPPAPKEEEASAEEPAKAEPAKPEAPAAKTDEGKPTPVLKAAKREIILEALDKVDVKFEVKGEVKRVSLAPTQVHTIRSDQPLDIDVSDGGAVNVILNGRERGPAGDLGKPKTIKIP